MPLADAYAACARLAAAHYENFPVASRLVPARMRPHVAAVYAFARTADDFADEDGYTLAERHALLDDWHRRLLRAAGSEIVGTEVPAPHPAADFPRSRAQRPSMSSRPVACEPGLQSRRTAVDPDAIFLALAHTIRSCALEVGLFEDLLSAFRQDTVVHAIRDVGRRARLLPPFGKPGGTARSADCRVSRRRSRQFVGRALHGPPAHELLAGSRRRLAPRPLVHPACRARCRRCRGMRTSTPRA